MVSWFSAACAAAGAIGPNVSSAATPNIRVRLIPSPLGVNPLRQSGYAQGYAWIRVNRATTR